MRTRLQPLDCQLAGVKPTLSLNRRTVTVDPEAASRVIHTHPRPFRPTQRLLSSGFAARWLRRSAAATTAVSGCHYQRSEARTEVVLRRRELAAGCAAQCAISRARDKSHTQLQPTPARR